MAVDLDLAMTAQLQARILEPFGVGDKADLHEYAFQFHPAFGAARAVLPR